MHSHAGLNMSFENNNAKFQSSVILVSDLASVGRERNHISILESQSHPYEIREIPFRLTS
jgi:hypothetical protein